MGERFSLRARARSFVHAAAGLRAVLATQHNARIHAAATLGVVAAGLGLGISRSDWCWLVAALASVWALEAMNTALESLADAAAPEQHPLVGRAKDAAAGRQRHRDEGVHAEVGEGVGGDQRLRRGVTA